MQRKESRSLKLTADARRIAILAANTLFNHDRVFKLVGFINKKWNFLSSVFVAYPASEEYALAYVYPRHRHLMRWKPWPVGIFLQDGKWGVVFVISSVEEDFYSPENVANLQSLVSRTEHICNLVGALQKTFAGVLPGLLFAKKLIRESVEADVTVHAILRSESQLRETIGYEPTTPLIVIGGMGFIGRRLIAKLKGREYYCVDTAGKEASNNLPSHLKGQPAIAINISRNAALEGYLDNWWRELVLLNEVYPEPSQDVLAKLTAIGSIAFHVVGVKARSFPPFPKAYAGGIPCCAARATEDMMPIIRQMNGR